MDAEVLEVDLALDDGDVVRRARAGFFDAVVVRFVEADVFFPAETVFRADGRDAAFLVLLDGFFGFMTIFLVETQVASRGRDYEPLPGAATVF